MRLLKENYGDVRIFQDRPFGYRRYHVVWNDGREVRKYKIKAIE